VQVCSQQTSLLSTGVLRCLNSFVTTLVFKAEPVLRLPPPPPTHPGRVSESSGFCPCPRRALPPRPSPPSPMMARRQAPAACERRPRSSPRRITWRTGARLPLLWAPQIIVAKWVISCNADREVSLHEAAVGSCAVQASGTLGFRFFCLAQIARSLNFKIIEGGPARTRSNERCVPAWTRVQSLFSSLGEEIVGQTIALGGDGRYFNKPAAQIIIKIAAGNGVKKVRCTAHRFGLPSWPLIVPTTLVEPGWA
jgi:Phosphoglucomutase/phosphomannomutase, alpha/beta/alpha domain I